MTTDLWVFAVWPYVAVACLAIGPIVRSLWSASSPGDLKKEFSTTVGWLWSGAAWRHGILWIVAGHLFMWVFPGRLLMWQQRTPTRLLIFEGALLGLGLVALVGLLSLIARRDARRRRSSPTSLTHSAILALMVVTIVSGLLLAVRYRWASSWSALVVTPYLASLAASSPDVSVVSQLPFLVRLHIASAFALTTILPFTSAMSLILFPLSRVLLHGSHAIEWAAGPAARRAQALQSALQTRARPRIAALLGGDADEE